MKILLIEDDIEISEMLCSYLIAENFEVVCAADGQKACEAFDIGSYSIVLLDLMIPKITGMNVMKYIRQKSTVPIIIISAKDSDSDKTLGLGLGADDYITKPFEIVEMLARVETVLRRYHKTEDVLQVENVTIDIPSRVVLQDGKQILLTMKEFELLLLFVRNKNIALYRETIYENVWESNYLGDSRTVDLHVQRLRKKLGWEGKIKSVYKVGYRLEV